MIARLLTVFALAVATLGIAPATAQTLFRPVAVVNDQAITGFDLAQRAQIMVAMGFSSASPDALRAEALDNLVEDRLKLQAGKEIGITPNQDLINRGIEAFASQSSISADEFRAVMNAQGVTEQALEDLAVAEIIWLQVIRARFGGRVQPGEADIDAELGLIEQRAAFEYRIQEIGLPLTGEGRTEAQTRALGEQLYNQLNQGGDFDQAVRQFSQAPSAATGGNVGWVSTQRMPPDLIQALDVLQPGQVSRPLTVAGGLSLIKLLEKRATGVAVTQNSQAREAVRERLINERSQRLADGLLQDMRRDALIEVR